MTGWARAMPLGRPANSNSASKLFGRQVHFAVSVHGRWLKALHKTPVLVVVGVSSLVDTRLHFGSFAMLPDHSALGVQAANLIFKLSEHQWNAAATPIQFGDGVLTLAPAAP